MSTTHLESEVDPHVALAALERFVVDNEQLLQLEERIGRFNKSDSLSVIRITGSNIDRWSQDDGPDIDKLLVKVREVLDRRLRELRNVPTALAPIVAEWAESNSMWRHSHAHSLARWPVSVLFLQQRRQWTPAYSRKGVERRGKILACPIQLAANYGFNAREIHQIERLIVEHHEVLIEAWNEHFN